MHRSTTLMCHCEEAAGRRGNLGKAVTFSPGVPCYPAGYCEIAPQGHFLALRAQGATSACGLLAMTNLGALRHRMRTAKIASLHGAHYPQGARRIRKAAKPPTAAQ